MALALFLKGRKPFLTHKSYEWMTRWIVSGLYLKVIPPCRNKANKQITLRLNKVILCKVSNSVLQEQTSNYVTLNLDPGSWSKDWLQGRIWSFSSSKTSPRMFSWNSCIIGWRPYVFLKCWKTNEIQRDPSLPLQSLYREELSIIVVISTKIPWFIFSEFICRFFFKQIFPLFWLHKVTFPTEGKCLVKVNDASP